MKIYIFVCDMSFEREAEVLNEDAEWSKRVKETQVESHFTEDTRLVLTDSSSFAAARLASDNISRLGSWLTPCKSDSTRSE